MRKATPAYRSAAILNRILATCDEPYATALYVHGTLFTTTKMVKREVLLKATIEDVIVDDDRVTVCGARLSVRGAKRLQSYLHDHLAHIDSEWLFPLPADPDKHCSLSVANRRVSRAINDK